MDQQSDLLFRLQITVTGRVQNVGFRAFVQQNGSQHALTGWVVNVGYNQVEIVAEGLRPALTQFAAAVREGPRGARVLEANEQWGPAIGALAGFRILPSR
jgi:acylphosphatase